MNKVLLADAAERLAQLLGRYADVDAEAKGLQDGLSALIDDARLGGIAEPLPWGDVPGGQRFNEGGLRKYADLEAAYALFKIELTGGESPVLRNLRSAGAGTRSGGK